MPIAAEHAFKEKSAKSLILLPFRTISKRTFQCETPCIKANEVPSITVEWLDKFQSFLNFGPKCIYKIEMKQKKTETW